MRFFAIFLIFAFVLAVSAAPRNVPTYDPEAAGEFNAQQVTKEKRTFESLQNALDEWAGASAKVLPSSSECADVIGEERFTGCCA
jgi:hypothetical protein